MAVGEEAVGEEAGGTELGLSLATILKLMFSLAISWASNKLLKCPQSSSSNNRLRWKEMEPINWKHSSASSTCFHMWKRGSATG